MLAPVPTLTTPRLVLRPMTEADIDAVFAACSNPRLTAYTLFETHGSRADAEGFFRHYALPNYAQGVADPLVIAWAHEPGRAVGCCGIKAGDQPHVQEFGYWVAEPCWNQGVATEAVGRLVAFAFENPAVVRVQARVIAGNAASVRVLEKLGFTHEGTHRSALARRGRCWDLMTFAKVRGIK